jgi:hypothetical protein
MTLRCAVALSPEQRVEDGDTELSVSNVVSVNVVY